MKVIAVDDEKNNLNALKMEAEEIEDMELVGLFQDPLQALEFVKKEPVEVAMLDIRMPGMDGLTLGRKIREYCPEVALVYVTAYKEYAYDAFQVDANSYLLKPFNRQDIEKAIEKARHLVSEEKTQADTKPRIFIRTFGRFEVFVDGRPVDFSSEKAKELFALLVDRRGGIVTTEEMLACLWEDRPDDSRSRNYCRKVIQRMNECLEQYGIHDIIIPHHRGGKSLDMNRVNCDYYQYLEGDETRQGEFHGEYMTNYSWAEVTLGSLVQAG
jgi:two-component SAPR family response regulator